MATYYFSGTCKWAKLKEPDVEYDKTKKAWKLDLYMDEKSMPLFQESGLQLKVRVDKEGNKFVTFKRPTVKIIKGEIINMLPPDLLDSENKPIDVLVGNDSTVTIKVSVYNSMKGKGHTLEAVRIDHLNAYEGSKSFTAEDVVPF